MKISLHLEKSGKTNFKRNLKNLHTHLPREKKINRIHA